MLTDIPRGLSKDIDEVQKFLIHFDKLLKLNITTFCFQTNIINYY